MTLTRDYDDNWDRWYIDKETGEKYAGVTSILNVLDKKGVYKGERNLMAAYLADHRKRLAELTKAQFMAEAKNDKLYLDDWRIAREIGTYAHSVLEHILKHGTDNLDVIDFGPVVDGWEGKDPAIWVRQAWEELNEEFDIVPVHNETMVFDPALGYAGTYDNAWYIDGELCIVDAKTNKNGPRSSVGLQNIAYAMAEKMYDEDGNVADNREFEKSRVFWLRPEGWNLYELRFDNDLWVDFRAILRAYKYTKLREKRVVEEALASDGLTFRRWF